MQMILARTALAGRAIRPGSGPPPNVKGPNRVTTGSPHHNQECGWESDECLDFAPKKWHARPKKFDRGTTSPSANLHIKSTKTSTHNNAINIHMYNAKHVYIFYIDLKFISSVVLQRRSNPYEQCLTIIGNLQCGFPFTHLHSFSRVLILPILAT